jgi:hypothetical protein
MQDVRFVPDYFEVLDMIKLKLIAALFVWEGRVQICEHLRPCVQVRRYLQGGICCRYLTAWNPNTSLCRSYLPHVKQSAVVLLHVTMQEQCCRGLALLILSPYQCFAGACKTVSCSHVPALCPALKVFLMCMHAWSSGCESMKTTSRQAQAPKGLSTSY